MTTTVHVDVPKDVGWTAEVTTVEREAGGRVRAVWYSTVNPGETRSFYAHESASVFVAEGKVGADRDGHSSLVGIFAFALGEPVGLVGTDERGTVIARAEYSESSRNYLVRYRAADGRLTEAWWSEAAIAATRAPEESAEVAGELPASTAQPEPALPAGIEAPAPQA